MYFAQYDLLEKLSKEKHWKFIEVRPDGVVSLASQLFKQVERLTPLEPHADAFQQSGFVPSNNAMNLAQSLALFLSFYAFHEGPGANVPYPGPPAAFSSRYTNVSQTTLAHFQIYSSLQPKFDNGEIYNIGDEDDGVSWEQLWPDLTSHFGLVGTGPDESFNISSYMNEHKSEWTNWVQKHGLKEGAIEATDFGFVSMLMRMAVFDRRYDLGKARSIGFVENKRTAEGYFEAFELMREAKIIP